MRQAPARATSAGRSKGDREATFSTIAIHGNCASIEMRPVLQNPRSGPSKASFRIVSLTTTQRNRSDKQEELLFVLVSGSIGKEQPGEHHKSNDDTDNGQPGSDFIHGLLRLL